MLLLVYHCWCAQVRSRHTAAQCTVGEFTLTLRVPARIQYNCISFVFLCIAASMMQHHSIWQLVRPLSDWQLDRIMLYPLNFTGIFTCWIWYLVSIEHGCTTIQTIMCEPLKYFYKNLAIANRSRVSCVNTNNNIMTLKSGLEVTQGHWKWYYLKAWVRFPIRLL